MLGEKKSGRRADGRPALNEALDFVRNGDTLIVTRLDRLARSTQDLHNLLAKLDAKGVGFRCLVQSGVDTTTSTGKLTLAILGAVSAFEADLRAERQAEGIAKAKSAGKYRSRSPSIDYAQVKKLHSQGNNPTEVTALLNIGRTSVYRALNAGEARTGYEVKFTDSDGMTMATPADSAKDALRAAEDAEARGATGIEIVHPSGHATPHRALRSEMNCQRRIG